MTYQDISELTGGDADPQFVIIDTQTGTILSPEHCVLVEVDDLPEDYLDALDGGVDSDICAVGDEYGQPLYRQV